MSDQAGNSATRMIPTSTARTAISQITDNMSNAAGPSSPTLSLPGAPADSGQYAASAQQAASSLPASSIPGSTGSLQMSYGALARPLAGARRPHRSDLSQGHTPQRGRRLSLPATSGLTVSEHQQHSGSLSVHTLTRQHAVMDRVQSQKQCQKMEALNRTTRLYGVQTWLLEIFKQGSKSLCAVLFKKAAVMLCTPHSLSR